MHPSSSRLAILAALLAAATVSPLAARAAVWQPNGATQIPLWPASMPLAKPDTPGEESFNNGMVSFVSRPTMTIYPAKGVNTGVAILVAPGGGYRKLAIDFEGADLCDWLTAKGITCAVLKYRVPGSGPNWNPDCNCRRIPKVPMALQDAQRAMGLLRQRAASLGVDPHRIGVMGFSAGGHVVAGVSNNASRRYVPIDAADALDSRPNFAIALYPGHLWTGEDLPKEKADGLGLEADIRVSSKTPPTFLLQAQDDPVDDVRESLAYYMALRKADIPTELHLYAKGGHAFGLKRTGLPIADWPLLVERWLKTIGMVGPAK